MKAPIALLFAFACCLLIAAPAPAAATEMPEPRSCEEVKIEMPDGTRLHGWIHHGSATGPRPVLWTMTPYTNTNCPGRDATFGYGITDRVSWARISYRGTGASEGEQELWGPGDYRDVRRVGDWLASQPYSDGLVPAGASAEGAWITFALGHPDVIAAVWKTSCADGYRGCVRSGGSLAGGVAALTAGEVGGYINGLEDRLRNGTADPLPPQQLAALALSGLPAFTEDTDGPFWSTRLGLRYMREVHAPVMFTTDLYDFVPHGMYLAYERTAPRNAWLSLGLGHAQPAAADQPGSTLHTLVQKPVRDFFRRHVFSGPRSREPAHVRLVTNLGSASGYKRGEVLVRDEPRWPLPGTRWTRLYLSSAQSGSAGSLNDGSLSLAPAADGSDPAPMATTPGPRAELRTTFVVLGAAAGALGDPWGDRLVRSVFDDMRLDEAIGLTYTTPPLARDTEISGPIVLTVNATSTAPDFDWQVRLTDVHPDGSSAWISDGQLRASLRRLDPALSSSNRRGDVTRPWHPYTVHEPVPILEPVEYTFELAPTSNVFRAGHRIRIDIQPIASSYLDSARSAGVGVLQVQSGGGEGSRVLLPVIPSRCQDGVAASAGMQLPACGPRLRFSPP